MVKKEKEVMKGGMTGRSRTRRKRYKGKEDERNTEASKVNEKGKVKWKGNGEMEEKVRSE